MKTHTPHLWDWPAAALAVLLTYVAAARLSVTARTPRSVDGGTAGSAGQRAGAGVGLQPVPAFVPALAVGYNVRSPGLGRDSGNRTVGTPLFLLATDTTRLEAVYLRAHRQPPRWLWRWIRWSEAASVERAFHAINQALTWLDSPPPPHATPQERAALLERLLPEAAGDIRLLTVAHERTLYAARAWPPAEARRAVWRLRFQAARAWMRRRFTHGEQA